ncbi:hypothetical protein TL16_g11854 [Triparma laevis f. inornata]|uniref:Uncharacterized protein n=2 Tax=Triparma laevis TaxID=1534972 RepID=A0A9W7FT65_9STRA|nr:hypothetical protein TL16_g11854 [Triparma laevis f. inornata]GMI17513.1 hypothetical protein TrLO_g13102 [Triparma laevis f. longispina]
MPRLNIIPAACTVALYNMATNAKNDIRSRMEEGDDEKHLYELLQALKRSSRNPGASRNPEEEFAEEVLFANETNNVLKR